MCDDKIIDFSQKKPDLPIADPLDQLIDVLGLIMQGREAKISVAQSIYFLAKEIKKLRDK